MSYYHKSMVEAYKNFADMADAQKQKRLALQQSNKEKFDQILRNQFEDFDGVGKWPLLGSAIPNITGIRFFRVPEMGQSLNVELHYKDNDKEKTALGSISNGGVLSIKLPQTLSKIDRDELFADVLRNIDQLNPSAWVSLSSNLIVSDVGLSKEHGDGPGPDTTKIVDTRRLEFLTNQPDFLVGAIGLRNLEGYFATLHRDMIVWDNENVGNAAFIRKLDHSLSHKEVGLAKIKSGKKALVARYIEPFIEHTRAELVQHGAERVVHMPNDEWIAQMTTKLNSISPLENRAVSLSGRREERAK